MARSDATDFVVDVLEGPAAGGQVILSGRMLPYRGANGGSVSFGMSQRSKLVWYQGNPVATQLVFGPELKPTTINGVWKERYLGEDQPIDLVEQFEELLMTGVQVRVAWSTIERQGIVKEFSWVPGVPTGGLGDIQWSCTFEWSSAGAPLGRLVNGQDLGLRDLTSKATAAFGQLRDLTDTLVGTVSAFAGLGHNLSAAIGTSVEDVSNDSAIAFSTLYQTAVRYGTGDPTPSTHEDAVAAATRAMDASADYAQTVATIFPGATSVSDDADLILLQHLDRVDVVDQAFDTLDALFSMIARLEDELRPEAFVVLRPTRRMDLRELAVRFYGDPDKWLRIAHANGITEGSKVPDDVDELTIPLSASSVVDPLRGL